MVKAEYIEGDRFAGVSLGLQYNYRYTHHKGHFVIYDVKTGEIIEHIENMNNDRLTEEYASKRLHEINGVKQVLCDEMRAALDAEK